MILIKNAKVVDPQSSFHGKKVDLLIEHGRFSAIRKKINPKKAQLIEGKNLHVSPGWLDIGAQTGEPGFEHREDLTTISKAAAAGGYTALAPFPNTVPVIHSKSEVNFLKNHSALVDFFPIGALSRHTKGVDLAELYDMESAGAVAFSDGMHSIASSGLMKRGLEYAKGINGLIINQPFDKSLAQNGQLHEGKVSTSLGMKGIPALAEVLMLKRDLDLLAYADSRLHVHNISTAESVKLIKTVKAKGLQVTASVAIMNLIYDQESLSGFDPNYKVLPPLRDSSDVKALVKGLQDGTIDVINSNHIPLEEEAKKVEFLHADFGTISLETTFALLTTHLKNKIGLEKIIEILAHNPRKILGLPSPRIEENAIANLSIFQPDKKWVFTTANIYSKSKNTPLVGQELEGKVLGIINGPFFVEFKE